MRKFVIVALVSVSIVTSYQHAEAQTRQDTIAQKEQALGQLTAERDQLQGQIDKIQGEINGLKPAVHWRKGGFTQLNFNQVSLTNWAAGGENSIAFTFIGNAFANYQKDRLSWDNSIDVAWGVLKSGDQGFRKSEDKIDINSKAGYGINSVLSAAALVNFKSQISPTYEYTEDVGTLVSYFGAPAYLLAGVGFDYKPNSMFSFYISPATGKFTFVKDDINIDETAYGVEAGETSRAEFGAYLNASFNKEIFKNALLDSKLALFNNYTDPDEGNRNAIDVDWQTRLSLQVNKYLSASIFGHLIYDNNTLVGVDDNDDGLVDRSAPRTQFKETLGIGLTYQFN